MNDDVRKVLELLCARLPMERPNEEPDFYDITLAEKDFKRQGMSIDAGVAALKYAMLTNEYGVIQVSNIYIASVENHDDPYLDGENVVEVMVHSSVYLELYADSDKPLKPIFTYKDAVLTVNGYKISFGTLDAKQFSAYVLDHLFLHNPDEPSDYRDIHLEAVGASKEDSYRGKRYYDASKVVNNQVSSNVGVNNFLLFKSGDNGHVRINPKYLP
ncbi:hypothetical protein BH11PAT2_BH11PAT2_05450 [soil metagenome]